MPALYPPVQRRRLARKYRWSAAALWFVLVFFGLVVLGNMVGDDAGGVRDDVHPVAAILAGTLAGGVIVFALGVVHSRSGAWRRAARIDAAPLLLRGVITEISHSRLASFVTVAIEGSSHWRFSTRDRNDTASVPGDAVTIELYNTVGKSLGVYRNDRTGHVRAVSTRIPD